jgi:hypothetical protein
MTLYANTFSISTMFSMIFSRTRKSEHLRSFAEKEKTSKPLRFQGFLWSCWADSNCRPHPYQGCALPTELQQQMATRKGFEPSTSGVTGRRSNQLNYLAIYLPLRSDKEQVYYNIYKPICKVFFMAGAERLELSTRGFGDRCSTN